MYTFFNIRKKKRFGFKVTDFFVNYTYLCLHHDHLKKSPGFTLIHAFMIVALCLQTSMQRGDFPEKRFHDLLVLHAIFDFFSVFQLWWFSCYYSGKVHTYVHEISRNSHLVSRFLKRFQTKNIWIFTLKINKIAALDYNVDFWRENSNIFLWKLLINLETKWEFWRESSNIFTFENSTM